MAETADASVKNKMPEEKAQSEEQAAIEKLSKAKPEEIAALLKKWLADE